LVSGFRPFGGLLSSDHDACLPQVRISTDALCLVDPARTKTGAFSLSHKEGRQSAGLKQRKPPFATVGHKLKQGVKTQLSQKILKIWKLSFEGQGPKRTRYQETAQS
jgi:hypothetical protein